MKELMKEQQDSIKVKDEKIADLNQDLEKSQ